MSELTMAILISAVLDYIGSIGVIWLITFCFDIKFSLKVATGIWFLLKLLRLLFANK